MQLICPNCGSRYAVPADAIPARGRTVQCGRCHESWLQMPEGADADTAETVAFPGAAPSAADAMDPPGHWSERIASDTAPAEPQESGADGLDDLRQILSERVEPTGDTPETTEAEADLDNVTRLDASPEDTAIPPLPDSGTTDGEGEAIETAGATIANLDEHRPLGDNDMIEGERPQAPDDDVLDELRTLIEKEEANAPSEEDIVEGDPMDMTAAGRRRRRPRRERPPRPDGASVTAMPMPGAAAVAEEAAAAPRRKSRAPMGFAMAVLVFAIATGVYLMAPTIAESAPQAQPVLEAYVSGVDALRRSVENLVTGLLG
ncbi:MAG: zinc-ribbon domain-containing protein [Rubricella sp.]